MVRFSFRKGLRFLDGKRILTLVRRTATSKLQFECESTGEIESLTEYEVYQHLIRTEWQIDETSLGPSKDLVYIATPKDIRSLNESDQNKIKRKLKYLNEVRKILNKTPEGFSCNPNQIKQAIESIAKDIEDKDPPHWSTLWRWWNAYKGTECFSKIVDGRHHNKFKTDPVQFSIFEEVVNEVFLTPQRMPGKAVVEGVEERISRINKGLAPDQHLKSPARATIYRWLDKLHRAVVDEARQGKAYTQRELRSVTGTVTVKDLLERAEIDHTPVDLLVVCQITRMVLGRPWLTLVIDRKSRMVLGFYLSFHSPSAYSVLYALRMAILPKDDLVAAIGGIKHPWPTRGLPRTVVMDNGMDLHANAVDAFALEAGIELQYCGAAHPELKGAIERMFRTLSHDLFHQLPGTVFNNVDTRGDYPSEKKAALDMDTLTSILVKWIVDIYHCNPHTGLQGRSPLEVWQELESKRAFELPAYPRQLDLIVGQIASRTLFHYGVEYDHIRYNSELLGTLRGRTGVKSIVQIRIYEHDISYIDVLMPDTDEYIRVPATDMEYCRSLNRHTHLLVRRQVTERFGDEWTQQQLRATKAEIQQMIADALFDHKAAKRKMAAARSFQDSDSSIGLRANQALKKSIQPVSLDESPVLPTLAASTLLPQFNISIQSLEDA